MADRTLKVTCTTATTDAVDTERVSDAKGRQPAVDLELFTDGRDEMNLAEFPLSAIADRFLDGRKTVVFTDQVWDRGERAYLRRELAISGSDRYGLPTSRDEDVLLACLQLTRLADFKNREVEFTRYELMKLLRWPDDGRSYQRLATSLRRWKGVTLFSDRAFYDHAQKSWVNRDFGVFDNLYLYERESAAGRSLTKSRFVWNEVLFSSFQSGYLKRLDWNLYSQFSDPVAKRLYRLLDKRFFRNHEVVFDLHDLAHRRIRLSTNYNTAQIKRALARGIEELESLWELRKLPAERRYVRKCHGRWQVVFHRKTHRQVAREGRNAAAKQADLAVELTRRGIGPATAEDLAGECAAEIIQTMIELFDWYAKGRQPKGPGFLVDSIRNSASYRFPPGFESSAQRVARRSAARKQVHLQQRKHAERESKLQETEIARLEPFMDFWSGLDELARIDFEIRAVTAAAPLKREGYHRLKEVGGTAFEQYRQVILRDFFEQSYVR